jgi:DNA-binding PadR family transcriptional regulator
MYRSDTSAILVFMLELAILGLLKEQELHGYELKKRLADTLGARSGVSYGSLYPALGRLETAGAVKAVESADVVPIPLTGSLGGELAAFRARRASSRGSRGKKVYGITDRGEQLFAELLTAESTSAEDERLFNLRLAFARYLPPGARLGLLERRRAHLLERLGRLSTRVRTGRDRLDGYAHSLLEHDRETTEHDLSWIDRLIATERSGGHPTAGTQRVGHGNFCHTPQSRNIQQRSTRQHRNIQQSHRQINHGEHLPAEPVRSPPPHL